MRRATDPKHNHPRAPGHDDVTTAEDSIFIGAHDGTAARSTATGTAA
ncbi:hypothetical protein [Parafrankia sp. EUN1f]|nr:hypothetical protein [Parafrankia sp. EUN1f]EFC79806.1 hypothetical protein FrEUN1fDRAFT_7081 [Parafrankia sp. EUN1f]